jgi:subtilisin family serine protease
VRRFFLSFAPLAVLAVLAVGPSTAGAQPIPGQYIVVLKDSANPVTVEAKHERKGAKIFKRYRHALNGYAATLSPATLSAVKADPEVRFVSQDRQVKLPKNPHPCCRSHHENPQRVRTGVDRIDGELSSARSGDGHGKVNINVAVLDTGVDPKQPELNVAGGFNCRTADPAAWQDVDGHGTEVAGVIAAQDNPLGGLGIAPGARVWSVRVFDEEGFGTDSSIACGADYVTASRTDGKPGNDIAVANYSGANLPGESELVDDQNCGLSNGDAVHLAICRATSAGVVWVNAAGNESLDIACCLTPTYDEVLTATAIGDYDGQPGGRVPPVCRFGGSEFDDGEFGQRDDQFAWFSNFATLASDRAHTVAAPGMCITATTALFQCAQLYKTPQTCYASVQGTSFAAPHVSGVVALCIAYGPCAGLSVQRIVQKIVADAAAYNRANPDYGYEGDPLRPISGKYYGYLIRAGLY